MELFDRLVHKPWFKMAAPVIVGLFVWQVVTPVLTNGPDEDRRINDLTEQVERLSDALPSAPVSADTESSLGEARALTASAGAKFVALPVSPTIAEAGEALQQAEQLAASAEDSLVDRPLGPALAAETLSSMQAELERALLELELVSSSNPDAGLGDTIATLEEAMAAADEALTGLAEDLVAAGALAERTADTVTQILDNHTHTADRVDSLESGIGLLGTRVAILEQAEPPETPLFDVRWFTVSVSEVGELDVMFPDPFVVAPWHVSMTPSTGVGGVPGVSNITAEGFTLDVPDAAVGTEWSVLVAGPSGPTGE